MALGLVTALSLLVGGLAGAATFLASRSFWLAVFVGFAIFTLHLLPLALALQASRGITQEQRERWGLAAKMTDEQRRYARRLGGIWLGTRLLLYGTLAAVVFLVDSPVIATVVVVVAFASMQVAGFIVARKARHHLPRPMNSWIRRAGL